MPTHREREACRSGEALALGVAKAQLTLLYIRQVNAADVGF